MTKKTSTRYAPEIRERAVRMVLEHQGDHGSQWAAIGLIAAKIGCTPSRPGFVPNGEMPNARDLKSVIGELSDGAATI